MGKTLKEKYAQGFNVIKRAFKPKLSTQSCYNNHYTKYRTMYEMRMRVISKGSMPSLLA